VALNPTSWWELSQNGLFLDAPQRHKVARKPMGSPSSSTDRGTHRAGFANARKIDGGRSFVVHTVLAAVLNRARGTGVSDLHDALDFHGIRGAAIHPGVGEEHIRCTGYTEPRVDAGLVSNNRSSFFAVRVSMPLTAAEAGAAPAVPLWPPAGPWPPAPLWPNQTPRAARLASFPNKSAAVSAR